MSTGKVLGVTGDSIFIATGDSSLAGHTLAIPRASEHVTWSSDSMKWEAGPATVQADTIVANVVRVKELQNENGEKIVVLDETLVRKLLDHIKDLKKEVEVLKLTKSDKRKPRAKTKPKFKKSPLREETWKEGSYTADAMKKIEELREVMSKSPFKDDYKDAY